ncbi:MAG: hypothetical protein AAFO69_13745, partial [Bacteroidota bacterium]
LKMAEFFHFLLSIELQLRIPLPLVFIFVPTGSDLSQYLTTAKRTALLQQTVGCWQNIYGTTLDCPCGQNYLGTGRPAQLGILAVQPSCL